MRKLIITENLIELSKEISMKALKEAEYFPIDRAFLERYLSRIMSVDSKSFIFYNFQQVNPTYVNVLFICLPELWQDITLDDLISMLNYFTNVFSYYSMIEFSYKYLEIDILTLVLESAIKNNYYYDVKQFLINQYNNIIKSEEERIDLEQGSGKEFFGYNENQWLYIRQKLLIDKRVSLAIQDEVYLKHKLNKLLA
ncbi:hypothetical protein [Pedobacter sp.]|uniref:hypothetical protein n=1 Tax=Pedobacter sp. TaxID=1411316 RepID=UPI0031D62EC2